MESTIPTEIALSRDPGHILAVAEAARRALVRDLAIADEHLGKQLEAESLGEQHEVDDARARRRVIADAVQEKSILIGRLQPRALLAQGQRLFKACLAARDAHAAALQRLTEATTEEKRAIAEWSAVQRDRVAPAAKAEAQAQAQSFAAATAYQRFCALNEHEIRAAESAVDSDRLPELTRKRSFASFFTGSAGDGRA